MKNNYMNDIKQNFKHSTHGLLPNFHTKYRNSFDQTFMNDEDDFHKDTDNLHQFTHSKALGGN